MIKNQIGQIINRKPASAVFIHQILVVFLNIDKCIVRDGNGSLYGIAIHFAKSIQLFEIYIFKSRKLLQNPAGRLVKAFLPARSEEHTSELQSRGHVVSRLL